MLAMKNVTVTFKRNGCLDDLTLAFHPAAKQPVPTWWRQGMNILKINTTQCVLIIFVQRGRPLVKGKPKFFSIRNTTLVRQVLEIAHRKSLFYGRTIYIISTVRTFKTLSTDVAIRSADCQTVNQ